MKRFFCITAVFAALFCVAGCDMFRKLAGRPTSREISAIRERIMLEEKIDRDSIAVLSDNLVSEADSLSAELKETLAESVSAGAPAMTVKDVRDKGVGIYSSKRISALDSAVLPCKYCTVFGVFGNPDNSDRLCSKIEAAGFKSDRIRLSSGLFLVYAEPSDSLADAYASFSKMSSEGFFTKDAWIMVVE